jgi:hypothetical protein
VVQSRGFVDDGVTERVTVRLRSDLVALPPEIFDHRCDAFLRDALGSMDALGEAHRRYTRMSNFRERWKGRLWQERFHSFVMDEQHLLAAVRSVERNPVRARLCARPEDWPWSSAAAHLAGRDERPGQRATAVGASPGLGGVHRRRRRREIQ